MRKTSDAGLREVFCHELERDCFARARGACDEAVAVCLVREQVAGIVALSHPDPIVLKRGSSLRLTENYLILAGGLRLAGNETADGRILWSSGQVVAGSSDGEAPLAWTTVGFLSFSNEWRFRIRLGEGSAPPTREFPPLMLCRRRPALPSQWILHREETPTDS